MRYNFKRRNGNYMSKKAKQYSATEKTKIVLEAIKAEIEKRYNKSINNKISYLFIIL